MHLLRRLIVWSIPIFWIAALELMRSYQDKWWLFIICLLVYFFLVLGFICKLNFNKNFWHFLILPMLTTIAAWLCLILFGNGLYFHVINVGIGLLLYFLINQYYLYFYLPFKYQPYSLESLSLYISILSALFFLVACFGSIILLQLSVGWITLAVFLFFSLLTYQYFWINKYSWPKSWPYVVIIILILMEIFAAVSYLPTGYYVNAFTLAVFYYLMLSFSKLSLSDNLTKKKVVEFLVVGGLCLLVVLISARWE